MIGGDPAELAVRARLHAALGDPARLAIVDALALNDASPGELARALSMPTNLLAHHIKVLEQAGLLVRSRSEGDRRRAYIHLVPDALTGLIPPLLRQALRVVFVCTHNSARSQLAAALWTRHSPVPVASAGTHPARRVHPRAVRIGRRHGVDLAAASTHHIVEIVETGDLVVAVCDNAFEELSTGHRVTPDLHWSIPDPARPDTDPAFEAAYCDLAGRVAQLAAVTTRSQP